MTEATRQPPWDPEDKAGSLRTFAEWLRDEARTMFLHDKTHGHILFLFTDDGLASMNPVPPKTDSEQVREGVRQAIREHDLYGVVSVAEAWTYYPRNPRDHTAIQLIHGEMTVSDLKDTHRTEALLLRMENRGGDRVSWVDPIIRDGNEVRLGDGMVLQGPEDRTAGSYFQ